MVGNRRLEDPAQADRLWTGYHPRAAVPAVAGTALVALLVWTGRWYVEDLSGLADRVGALAVFAMAWGVWPAVAAVYLYRAATYTYRLTDRAVLIDFGFWHRPVPPVWLTEITAVRAGAGWVGRLLGVGWVEVRTALRTERLIGVRHAEAFAERIRAASSCGMTHQ
jgi:uncharacterized membrane protein YdbT with pleckstrin-like domain